MTKPADLLKLARYKLPDGDWTVLYDGSVYSDRYASIFSIEEPRDRQAVMMKLAQQGYKFTHHKDGLWSATKQSAPNMRGTVGPHTLEQLLVILVEGE